MIIATIINTLLKLFFIRERPFDSLVIETGYSYPSGHSFVSLAFYGFLIYLIIKSNFSKNIKYLWSGILIILIALIGISRIYLGVHFPSDVLGGFIAATIYLIIYIEIIKKLEGEKNEKKE